MVWYKRILDFFNKPSRCAYLFLAPSLILLLLFSVSPLFIAFVLSLFDANMSFDSAVFSGLDNFREAFSDDRFINSLKVTATFAAIEIPVLAIGSMIIAELITKNNMRNKFLRAVYFLPVICSATAIGIMWRMNLHSNIGIITYVIRYLGLGKVNFLNTPGLTIFVVVFISIWRKFGISAIIYVTAMQQVDISMYEAAKLDGANRLQKFICITVPAIKPTFWFILMTRFAESLQIFDIIFTTTYGGPNFTTESSVSYIYSRAFSGSPRMGYASALSVILFGIIMTITLILYIRMNKEARE